MVGTLDGSRGLRGSDDFLRPFLFNLNQVRGAWPSEKSSLPRGRPIPALGPSWPPLLRSRCLCRERNSDTMILGSLSRAIDARGLGRSLRTPWRGSGP